jgi:hypothetical protein
MSEVYLIPRTIPCQSCGVQLSYIEIAPAADEPRYEPRCPLCDTVQTPEHVARFVGVIRDCGEPPPC